MSTNINLKINLPKIPNIELVAIEGLELMGEHFGIAGDKIGEAKILVTEAVINALEHTDSDNSCVEVEFNMSADKLIILVTDNGSGFKPDELKEPDIQEKITSSYKRGWGLKLMKSMSDDLIIESGTKGTKISIIKNLK
jgi:anti-sigma regulatory factor (Ser/Thr protein kinase)